MAGPALEAVQQGAETMVAELRRDPYALETAFISVLTFAQSAQQVVPLTEVGLVQIPRLSVRPGTALGGALGLLVQRIDAEVVRAHGNRKGDFRPLVFLLTDGQPTDSWEAAADEQVGRLRAQGVQLYGVGCGPDVDFTVLAKIADVVLEVAEVTPESLAKLFVWLRTSIQSASTPAVRNEPSQLSLGPLPDGMVVRGKDEASLLLRQQPRQLFLFARCSQVRRPYLIRFRYDLGCERYVACASHPLDELDRGEAPGLPPVPSTMLVGASPCPYCERQGWGCCGGCRTVFCWNPDGAEDVQCPGCRAKLTLGDGSFDLTQSAG